jgi:AraC-like DNA-binding protein
MRHNELRILAGAKRQPSGYRFATSRYEQFQVIYVHSGTLQLASAYPGVSLGPGQAAVLPSGSEFRLASSKGYAGVFCIVAGPVPSAMRGDVHVVAHDRRTRALAEMMLTELHAPCEDSTRLLESLGYALAWRGVHCSPARPGGPEYDTAWWADRVRQQIDANIYSPLGCREILAPLARSYRQLARSFRSVWSMTPKRYQLQAKITEARRLLETAQLSVTDIAMELGFSSSQHLATAFKSVTGSTPAAWRLEAIKKRARAETRAR